MLSLILYGTGLKKSLWELNWTNKIYNKLQNPTDKKFFIGNYIIPLGKLVDPNDPNPRELGLKLLEAFSNKKSKLASNEAFIWSIYSTGIGKKLMARINQVKNQDAPN